MRILICPDKFKGSLSAAAAARAIERGVRRALPRAEVQRMPLADGGEGSMELLGRAYGLRAHRLRVTGPLRKPVRATYYLGGGRAVIESAAACGLHLVPPPRRDPGETTTIGVGMLLEEALSRGARDILLLLGGSATNDCGAGMAAALGYRFFTASDADIVPTGASLQYIDRIDTEHRNPALASARITVLCDVNNPLLGPHGATYTYARQKGAREDQLDELEENVRHFSELLIRDVGAHVAGIPGSGAAGGLGAGALAFLGAKLRSGAEVILEAVGFSEAAASADLVITGEGSIDEQTLHGKVVAGVTAAGRRTLAVCGRSTLAAGALGVEAILSFDRFTQLTIAEKMDRAAGLLEEVVYDYLARI